MSDYYELYWQKNSEWTPSAGGLQGVEKRLLEPLLKDAPKVLDYGCGDCLRCGHELTASGCDYHGFDISREAVEIAVEHGITARLLKDSGEVPEEDSTFDLAICFEVLEHLMEPQKAVREIARNLKKGSKALFSVPNSSNWFQRLEFLATGFWNPGGSPLTSRKTPWQDPHIRFFSPKVVRRLLLENGFDKVEIHGSDFDLRHLPYVYRKPGLAKAMGVASYPFKFLGRAFPGLFSIRTYLLAEKA